MNKFGVFAIRGVWVPEAMNDTLIVNMVWIGDGFFWQVYPALKLVNSNLVVKRLLEAGEGSHDYWRLAEAKLGK